MREKLPLNALKRILCYRSRISAMHFLYLWILWTFLRNYDHIAIIWLISPVFTIKYDRVFFSKISYVLTPQIKIIIIVTCHILSVLTPEKFFCHLDLH